MEVILPNRTFPIPTSLTAPPGPRARRRFTAEIEEIRVCTNRTCRRQGSFQTLETLTGLAPANVAVKSCGCLGRCGAGPNLVALPDGVVVSHCGTAARAAEVMVALYGGVWNSGDTKKSLEALALRKKAEKEMENGNFSEAELLLSQAIELKPTGGVHIIYKDRSIARLALHRYSEALEDAKEALTLSTQYCEAYICQGDAFLAMDQLDLAEESYLRALDIDPSVRRSKSFKARVAKLQEKLTAGNMPACD
uniref:uncharacterized protein LOC107419715 n=1 Tax=Ziziphus jujuba TaxID=326968 RepID=A0A6P3ZS54_ZIZJJ